MDLKEQKNLARGLVLSIAGFVKSRKMDLNNTCLKPDATLGFNLACDFVSNELTKIAELENYYLLDVGSEDDKSK